MKKVLDENCRDKTHISCSITPPPPKKKSCLLWNNVEKYFVAEQAKDEYGACSLHAGHLELQIHTQNMYCLLFFCCNDGCTNAPQCCAMPALHVLFFLVSADELVLSKKKLWNAKFVLFIWLEAFMMIRVIKCCWVTSRVNSHISYPTFRRSVLCLSSRQSLQLNATRSSLPGKKSTQSGLSGMSLPALRSLYQVSILPVDGLLCLEDGGCSLLRNFTSTPRMYAALFS